VETGKAPTGQAGYAASDPQDAFRAALATHCAEEQGKFWEMHDRLFANQRAIEPLKGHAEALGLEVVAFESCMASEKYGEAVKKDMAEAQKAGVSGTPSYSGAHRSGDPTKVKDHHPRRPTVRRVQNGDRKALAEAEK
jgi:hypothetical protein